MDLRERLRDLSDLSTLPAHIDVRRAPNAGDERCLLIFTDATPTEGPDYQSWFDQCTGTIVAPKADGTGYDVVGFPGARSLEVSADEEDGGIAKKLLALYVLDPEGAEWYPYVEGVRMTLYHYKGEWCLSTSRVIDARTSRYYRGSSSFGQQFDAAACRAGLNMSRLDKGRTYVFIVQTPDTPMVVPYTNFDLLHVATYDLSTSSPSPSPFEPLTEAENEVGVTQPSWMATGGRWDDVRAFLDGPLCDGRLGVLARGAWACDRAGQKKQWHAKIMHADYAAARDLVGGDRDLEKRLLSIATDPVQKARLLALLPTKRQTMLDTDAAIDAATKEVLRLYIEFNVHRRRSVLPQPIYETLKALHATYLARPVQPGRGTGSQTVGRRPRVTFGDVDAFVRRLPPPTLASLLRATCK